MKLVATHTPTSRSAAFDFTEPGGTIGRCPGNHLLLSEDAEVGRIQAVVRIKDGRCSLMSVSSRADIQLNGQALPLLQEAPITRGDTLTIGDYTLQAAAHEPAPAVVAAAATAAAALLPPEPEAPVQDTSDIFKALLDGPGVLPVGVPAGTGHLHPFELDSQAPRNHPDPLQQLQVDVQRPALYETNREHVDTEPDAGDSHIFSNPTPSTLDLADPLAPQRRNPIDEALTQGLAGDGHHKNR
ncbi:FHA domain-containing protein [Pusillimonas sp. SM2304]|uniref:FHA domain-containing protein n=1 Tax=Pusillimonas sp. SM2304 TaxID=3073241 RepID=UPI002874EBEB|nr:FHA domain-containing protein [Pusillimonas sp. SM2304]MDS1142253.1 FHA domain-containing protein [Pusillimonas sp. SM2304]